MDAIYTPWLDAEVGPVLAARPLSVLLVADTYAPDITRHVTRAEIPVAAVVAEQPLQNLRFEEGMLFADDVTFPAVPAPASPLQSLVIVDTTTGRLVAVMQDVVGLSRTASGDDLLLAWNPTCGILAL